ncbi:MAG: 2Fe-2S iron-sulfur cluster binding domain-containing protein [Caldilineaceae bacterium]
MTVPVGTLVVEAAQAAGLDLHVPCGGQGRCGRCAVQVDAGAVRRRSSLRLSPRRRGARLRWPAKPCWRAMRHHAAAPGAGGRRLTTDRTAPDNQAPLVYDPAMTRVCAPST